MSTHRTLRDAQRAHEDDGGFLLVSTEDYDPRVLVMDGSYRPTRSRPIYIVTDGEGYDSLPGADVGYSEAGR
jgi:hypothetical protein